MSPAFGTHGPAVVTGGVTLINLMVGQIIASAQDSAIALLNYADRINQLPLSVIGIAVGVVLLPELFAPQGGDEERSICRIARSNSHWALRCRPHQASGHARSRSSTLYERSAFTETTTFDAAALAAFTSGLPAYVAIKVFHGLFRARGRKTPMRFMITQMVINMALSLALFPL